MSTAARPPTRPPQRLPEVERKLDSLLAVAKSIQRMVGVITFVLGLAAVIIVLLALGVNLGR